MEPSNCFTHTMLENTRMRNILIPLLLFCIYGIGCKTSSNSDAYSDANQDYMTMIENTEFSITNNVSAIFDSSLSTLIIHGHFTSRPFDINLKLSNVREQPKLYSLPDVSTSPGAINFFQEYFPADTFHFRSWFLANDSFIVVAVTRFDFQNKILEGDYSFHVVGNGNIDKIHVIKGHFLSSFTYALPPIKFTISINGDSSQVWTPNASIVNTNQSYYINISAINELAFPPDALSIAAFIDSLGHQTASFRNGTNGNAFYRTNGISHLFDKNSEGKITLSKYDPILNLLEGSFKFIALDSIGNKASVEGNFANLPARK